MQYKLWLHIHIIPEDRKPQARVRKIWELLAPTPRTAGASKASPEAYDLLPKHAIASQ